MAYIISETEQNRGSKAIANQTVPGKSGGRQMPAVSPIQQKTDEDSKDKQVNPSQKEDEGWDLAEEPEIAGGQISLPTTEQFASQTNAGIFARRDDLLKQIDTVLFRCNIERELIYEIEVWLTRDHSNDEVDIRDRMMASGKQRRKTFKQKLDELKGLANAWLDHFKNDTSSGIAQRRASIEALLPAIQAEQLMTTKQRVQKVQEKEADEKAKAEIASRTIFTIEEFKAEAKIWVVIPF